MLVLTQESDKRGLKSLKFDQSPVKDCELSAFDVAQFDNRWSYLISFFSI